MIIVPLSWIEFSSTVAFFFTGSLVLILNPSLLGESSFWRFRDSFSPGDILFFLSSFSVEDEFSVFVFVLATSSAVIPIGVFNLICLNSVRKVIAEFAPSALISFAVFKFFRIFEDFFLKTFVSWHVLLLCALR